MATETLPRLTITVEEVCQRLGISQRLAYKGLKSGQIPAMQIGAKWIISERRFNEWLNNGGNGLK